MTDTNDDTLPSQIAPIEQKPGESEFRLQFNVEGGESYENGLYQWMTILIVNGGAFPRASLFLTRHNGDLIGRPIGLFSQELTMTRAKELSDRFEGMNFAKLPEPTGGDVNANTLRIQYQKGFRIIDRAFNAENFAFIEAVTPIMDEMEHLMVELMTNPERAIIVSLDKPSSGGREIRFAFRITNLGKKDVIVADPRSPSVDSREPKGFIQVASMPVSIPGEMELPPDWNSIELEALPLEAPSAGHTIRPNESFIVQSEPWTAPSDGEYVAQAILQDYHGPIDIDPSTVQPIVPKDAESSDKPFVVRGAAFSSYLIFVVGNNQE